MLTFMGRRVRFYRKENGRCPVEEFLDELPKKSAAKCVAVVSAVEREVVLSDRFLKKLQGQNLYEIRVLHARQALRFICFFGGRDLIIATHGFIKKSERTPRREIELAKRYRYDYLRRMR